MYKLITLAVTALGEEGGLDAGLSEVLQQIEEVVNGTLMPIIYVSLGLFLVVKGAIIGTQIVKAADEPQLRQEKINSLKYLVIGIAIAYVVALVADALLGYFAGVAGVGA